MRLQDWLDRKQIGSGVLVAIVTVVLAAAFPILSAFIPRLGATIGVPVWLFISACALTLGAFWWLVASRKRLQEEGFAVAEQRDAANEKLNQKIHVAFDHGAYFSETDSGMTHPYCRNCWEADGRLVSAREYLEEDRNGDWQYAHHCPNCNYLYWDANLPNTGAPADEDIPF